MRKSEIDNRQRLPPTAPDLGFSGGSWRIGSCGVMLFRRRKKSYNLSHAKELVRKAADAVANETQHVPFSRIIILSGRPKVPAARTRKSSMNCEQNSRVIQHTLPKNAFVGTVLALTCLGVDAAKKVRRKLAKPNKT